MITLSATRAFKGYHFEVPYNLSKNVIFYTFFFIKGLDFSDGAIIFALAITKRAISSVGLEHLPYKQGVVGSNPSSPTKIVSQGITTIRLLFPFLFC